MTDEIRDAVRAEIDKQLKERGAPSSASLADEFRQEVRDVLYPRNAEGKLLPSRARGIETLRAIQQSYVERGAKIEDLDVSPKGGVTPGTTIRDWYPPAGR